MVGARALILCGEAEGPGLVQPGAEMASVEPDSRPQDLWGDGEQDDRAGLFPAVHSGRTRENGQELKQERFSLGLRHPFLLLRSIRW